MTSEEKRLKRMMETVEALREDLPQGHEFYPFGEDGVAVRALEDRIGEALLRFMRRVVLQ